MASRPPLVDVDVPTELDGARVDQALAALAPTLSRRHARRLLEAGTVFVDDRRIRILSVRVQAGQRLVAHEAAHGATPPTTPVTVLDDDGDVLLVDKPAGMPVEPTRQGAVGTLAETLRRQVGPVFIAHRLDAGTSGVMAVARHVEAQRRLNRLFAAHAAERIYLAVVSPPPSFHEASFDAPLDGKPALTHTRVLARSPSAALLRVALHTGRTRQIRRHLAQAGHPVVGDRDAGSRAGGRLMLHAAVLSWPQRSGLPARAARAALPQDFRARLAELGLPEPDLATLA